MLSGVYGFGLYPSPWPPRGKDCVIRKWWSRVGGSWFLDMRVWPAPKGHGVLCWEEEGKVTSSQVRQVWSKEPRHQESRALGWAVTDSCFTNMRLRGSVCLLRSSAAPCLSPGASAGTPGMRLRITVNWTTYSVFTEDKEQFTIRNNQWQATGM